MNYIKDLRPLVKEKSLEEMEALLDKNPELIDYVDWNSNSLVTIAVDKGNIELLQALIKRGVDVNVVNAEGMTPLIIATVKRSQDIMTILLENGENIEIDKRNENNQADRYKYTALMYAVYLGFKEGVEILLKKGANVNSRDNERTTPLMLAAILGDVCIIKSLLAKREIEMNNRDVRGCTALIHAIDSGYIEIVKLLLEKEADVNISDNEGRTALIYAIRTESEETINLLLTKGVTINKADNHKLTALSYVISGKCLYNKKQQYNIIKKLIENDAAPYALNEEGASTYELANPEIKKFIRTVAKNGADDFESPEVKELPEEDTPEYIKKARETIHKFMSIGRGGQELKS